MDYEILLKREMTRKCEKFRLDSYVATFIQQAYRAGRGKGWKHTITSSLTSIEKKRLYTARLTFAKMRGHQKNADEQWYEITEVFKSVLVTNRWASAPWEITAITEVSNEARPQADPELNPVGKSLNFKDYGLVNLEIGDHFDHIFERAPHILRVYSAIETAVQTDLHSRNHCVLYGPPGVAKSEILLSFGKMMGKENVAYMKFDATSMTQAGVLRILTGSGILPPVLIVEEIEKTSDKDLRWLLGLLDKRGEVRQTNFNVGNRMRNAKMLCLATVNDMELFRQVMSGALASRFSNQIYCSRPTKAVIRMILAREIKLIDGKEEWIDPAIEFCFNKMGWNDPRQIIPVCVCGKDRLLDGSYQEAILATLSPEELEKIQQKNSKVDNEDEEISLADEVKRLQNAECVALEIVADAICHGMPVTKKITDWRTGCLGKRPIWLPSHQN